jgi:hypothetical protein
MNSSLLAGYWILESESIRALRFDFSFLTGIITAIDLKESVFKIVLLILNSQPYSRKSTKHK